MSGWSPSLPTTATKIRLLPTIQSTNNLAIQSVISASSLNGGFPLFPFTGSPTPAPIYMYLDAAPSGWTLFSSVSDSLLGIKGGTVYTVGGVITGSWDTGDYTLVYTDIPFTNAGIQNTRGYVSVPTNVTNNAHKHTWTTTRPMAAVGILATKNA